MGTPILLSLLSNNEDAQVAVFVNFKSETFKYALSVESAFISNKLEFDVLQINGDMDKYKQCALIRLLTRAIKLGGFNPNVLVAIPAANTGFDAPLMLVVICVGIP